MKKESIRSAKSLLPSSRRNKWIQSPAWFLGFCIFTGACLILYQVHRFMEEVDPATVWGMSYGIAAAVLFVGVGLYGVRRRTMRFRPGKTWYYLQFHVYAGTLFLLLVFMHVGFEVPQGTLNWWLWFLSIWVVLSGVIGILIQKWIPTLLNTALSIEVHYDRIPELIREIKEKAESVVENGGRRIRDFYSQQLSTSFAGPQPRWIYFVDITGGRQWRSKQFAYLRSFLGSDEQDELDALEQMYKTKLEIDAHYTLQRALRWWLYAHLPVAVMLVVLLGYHIFSVVYY